MLIDVPDPDTAAFVGSLFGGGGALALVIYGAVKVLPSFSRTVRHWLKGRAQVQLTAIEAEKAEVEAGAITVKTLTAHIKEQGEQINNLLQRQIALRNEMDEARKQDRKECDEERKKDREQCEEEISEVRSELEATRTELRVTRQDLAVTIRRVRELLGEGTGVHELDAITNRPLPKRTIPKPRRRKD